MLVTDFNGGWHTYGECQRVRIQVERNVCNSQRSFFWRRSDESENSDLPHKSHFLKINDEMCQKTSVETTTFWTLSSIWNIWCSNIQINIDLPINSVYRQTLYAWSSTILWALQSRIPQSTQYALIPDIHTPDHITKRGQKWHLKRYHMAPKTVPKSVPGNSIRLMSKRCRFGHRIWDPGIEHPDIENVVILRNYRKKDEIEVKTQNRAESWSKPRIWRQNDESGT